MHESYIFRSIRIQSVPLMPLVLGVVGLTGKAQAHLIYRFCSIEIFFTS
jgi:hypothetical protein